MIRITARAFMAIGVIASIPSQSLMAQEIIRAKEGTVGFQLYGANLASIGDINADGIPDVAVASLGGNDLAGQLDFVEALSGADFTTLWTLTESSRGTAFGFSMDTVGDVNADGHPDLVIGASQSGNTGEVVVASGLDGTVLHRQFGAPHSQFGYAVAGVGDVDGDGIPDYVVGAPRDGNAPQGVGTATVFSGDGSRILFVLSGDIHTVAFALAVSGAGDVDGDGTPDILIGDPEHNRFAEHGGCLFVYSGRDGSLVRTTYGSCGGETFARSIASLGDLDGDGHADYAVSIDEPSCHEGFQAEKLIRGSGRNQVTVYSGRTGQGMFSMHPRFDDDGFGLRIDSVGDVNGDGIQELAIDGRQPSLHSGRQGDLLAYLPSHGAGGLPYGSIAAPIGDLDGDGYAEWTQGYPGFNADLAIDKGRVEARRGHGVFLWSQDRSLSAGDSLQLRVRGGVAGAPVLVVLESFGGLPLNIPIFRGTMDAEGRLDAPDILIPAGYEGLSLVTRAYSLSGTVITSGPESVRLH